MLHFQVGDVTLQRSQWLRPEDYSVPPGSKPPISYLRISDGAPADVGGQMAAAIAAATLALHRADAHAMPEHIAANNLRLAHRLFTSVMVSPTTYTESGNVTGTAITDSYPSGSYFDDLFWAATWLLRASQAGLRAANETYYYRCVLCTALSTQHKSILVRKSAAQAERGMHSCIYK